jgi:hypothetical protein
MKQNDETLNSLTAAEWLASCGFLFPSSAEELERFEHLNAVEAQPIVGDQIDPFRIIRRTAGEAKAPVVSIKQRPRRLIAGGAVPIHPPARLLKKLKKT